MSKYYRKQAKQKQKYNKLGNTYLYFRGLSLLSLNESPASKSIPTQSEQTERIKPYFFRLFLSFLGFLAMCYFFVVHAGRCFWRGLPILKFKNSTICVLCVWEEQVSGSVRGLRFN